MTCVYTMSLVCCLSRIDNAKIMYVAINTVSLSSSSPLHVRFGYKIVFDFLVIGPRDSHVSQVDFVANPNVQSIVSWPRRQSRHEVQVIMGHFHPVGPENLRAEQFYEKVVVNEEHGRTNAGG